MALLAVASILLSGCGSSPTTGPASSTPPQPTSTTAPARTKTESRAGIEGRVLLGPTCPVQRVGRSCVRGYQATIAIFRTTGHRRVGTIRSGPDGRFRVRARPGRYTLEATRRGLPRLSPRRVTVRPGHFTYVTLMFDTGIR
jgi:hypothetical protein